MKKKILYLILGIVLFLAITNPSLKDFEEGERVGRCYKESNWFVFSYFVEEDRKANKTYIGFCKNFVLTDEEEKVYQITEWQQ
jgi:hypothetical protein